MVRGRGIAVTAVTPTYQCAETTSNARGRGSCSPSARHAPVKPFTSSMLIGLPWPMNKAGIDVMVIQYRRGEGAAQGGAAIPGPARRRDGRSARASR
jgi:hypothetical protein